MLKKLLDGSENTIENGIFRVRWILLPGYITLCICLAIIAVKILLAAFDLIHGFAAMHETTLIVETLTIVDMVLVTNLLLMVIFVGYVNFVSKINFNRDDDRPRWMDLLDYSGLKIQLLGSILAISSVSLLKEYMDIDANGDVNILKLTWLMLLHGTFVVSLLILALVNKLKGH